MLMPADDVPYLRSKWRKELMRDAAGELAQCIGSTELFLHASWQHQRLQAPAGRNLSFAVMVGTGSLSRSGYCLLAGCKPRLIDRRGYCLMQISSLCLGPLRALRRPIGPHGHVDMPFGPFG